MFYNPSKYHRNLKEEDVIWCGIDLDKTLAEGIWPQEGIGKPIKKTVQWAQKMDRQGYKIIIHTSRPWSERKDIEMWCNDHGVPFKEIHCGKPFYKYYVDDKNYFLPWINK